MRGRERVSQIGMPKTSIGEELGINEEDISVFKRVVQQIVYSFKPSSDPRNSLTLNSTIDIERQTASIISDFVDSETELAEEYHSPFVAYLLKLRRLGTCQEELQ